MLQCNPNWLQNVLLGITAVAGQRKAPKATPEPAVRPPLASASGLGGHEWLVRSHGAPLLVCARGGVWGVRSASSAVLRTARCGESVAQLTSSSMTTAAACAPPNQIQIRRHRSERGGRTGPMRRSAPTTAVATAPSASRPRLTPAAPGASAI